MGSSNSTYELIIKKNQPIPKEVQRAMRIADKKTRYVAICYPMSRKVFSELHKIREWNVDKLKLQHIDGRKVFKEIKDISFINLSALNLSSISIESIQLIHTVYMPKLEVLILSQNRITQGACLRKARWKFLKLVSINNNKFKQLNFFFEMQEIFSIDGEISNLQRVQGEQLTVFAKMRNKKQHKHHAVNNWYSPGRIQNDITLRALQNKCESCRFSLYLKYPQRNIG